MKNLIVIFIFLFGFQSLVAQKRVALYWDASFSMKERQLSLELQYLDNYFKKNTDVEVSLIMFSNDIILEENYSVTNGKWSLLNQELKNTIYDGATAYSVLFQKQFEEYLLFTDGNENINKLKPPTDKPIYIVSTLSDSNAINLKLIADLSNGAYVYLNQLLDSQKGEEKIEQIISEVNEGYISGFISGVEGSLGSVSIINKNSDKGVASNADGSYKIKAVENDILVYTYLGKKTINIRVSNVKTINVSMQNIDENLEEVVVTSEIDKEDLINTGNLKVNKRSLGYDIESIGEDEISQIDTNVKQAVKGQFSNLNIQNNTTADRVDLSQFLGRGKNMTITGNQYGLIVVDGIPLEPSDSSTNNEAQPYFDSTKKRVSSSDHIDPAIIVDITYLKGLAATNKYGSMGRNGVLLITTKNGVIDKPNEDKKVVLGTTAFYSGNAQQIDMLPDTPYINVFVTSKSIDEAFNNYLDQRKVYGDNPEFYLDAYDYFKGWNNDLLSKRVLSNVSEIAYDNVNVLRALSYKQHERGDYNDALITLKRVKKLQPKQAQSYRDLALAQAYAHNYNEAIKTYYNIDNNIGVSNSNFSGIKKVISNDARNLIAMQKDNVETDKINPLYLRESKHKARIIFEWNNLGSEFDLNIINPQKRFFTWSHTRAENSQRIEQQQEQGYGMEEFYLTSSDVGEWTFNLKYYGSFLNAQTPTYIKITTYKNFGYPNQTKDIQVVRLDKKNIEQTISKLVVN